MDKGTIYGLVGERIKAQRRARKITQDQLAQALDLKRTSITNIECGRQTVLLHTLYAMADILGCDIRDLLPSPEPSFKLGQIKGEVNDMVLAWLPDVIEQVVTKDVRGKGVTREEG